MNPILLSSDRRSRKRKSIQWQPDEKIHKIHYFEYIADERINVTKINTDKQNESNASANSAGGSSLNANNKLPNAVGGKISNASVDPVRRSSAKTDSDKCLEYSAWRPLIPIDFTPELPSPGWNSIERSAQAEREAYVLGAIDLPGQAATLDEPDQQPKSGPTNGTNTSDPTNKESVSDVKIIPSDSSEGMYTEYPDMYGSEFVNGVRIPTDNPQPVVQPFCTNQQQSQVTPNFQTQLVHATQQTNFTPFQQDMGAQLNQLQQQQSQMQFPFQYQLQQPLMPFVNQQQQQPQLQVLQQQQQAPQFIPEQQSRLTGPVMPWLSYPFNQVNENSHTHLFRRPAT